MKWVSHAPGQPYRSVGEYSVDLPQHMSIAQGQLILRMSNAAFVSEAWRRVYLDAVNNADLVSHIVARAEENPDVDVLYVVKNAQVAGLTTVGGKSLTLEFFV